MDRRGFVRGLGALSATGLLSVPARGGTAPGGAAQRDWELRWRTRLSAPEQVTSGLDLHAIAGAVVAAGGTVSAYDAADGSRLWRAPDLETEGSVVADGAVVVLEPAGTLHALDPATGDTRWETTLGADAGGQPSASGSAVLVPLDGELIAVDPADGRVRWRTAHDGVVTGVATDDGTGYATTGAGSVVAVDLRDGRRSWTVDLDGPAPLQRPAVEAGTVVAVDAVGDVHAVSADGAFAWRHRWPDYLETVGSPGIGTGRCFVTGMERSDGDRVVTVAGLDIADGSRQWTHQVVPPGYRSNHRIGDGVYPQPTVADGAVWGVGTTTIVALAPADGALRRRWRLPGVVRSSPLVTGRGGYFAGGNALSALDSDGGECDPPSVRNPTVAYRFPVPDGKQLHAEGRLVAEECPHLALVELWVEDRLHGVDGVYVSPTGDTEFRIVHPTTTFPPDVDATLRVRGTGGTVVAERTVPVADYRDAPANFQIACASLDAHSVAPGEPVTATLDVRNYGSDQGYVATLGADGEVVAEDAGEIPPFHDDDIEHCEGSTVTLTHVFEEAGEYHLRAKIAPRGDEGGSDTTTFDPLRVEGSSPVVDAADDPVALGVGGAAVAAIAGAYWHLRGA